MVKSNCRWIVAGNHDLHAAGAFPSYSNGFTYPENWFELALEERKKISRGRIWCYEGDEPNDLDTDDLLYLRQLPEHLKLKFQDVTCLLSHNIYPDLTGSTTRFIKRPIHLKEHWELMHRHDVKFSFCGHFHNHFAGFAYRKAGLFSKAIHSIPRDSFNMGQEEVIIVIPPLAGERGRTSFSVIDMTSMQLNVIAVN
jgi:hypothetical protein